MLTEGAYFADAAIDLICYERGFSMFSKFAEISPVVWGILVCLVIAAAVLYTVVHDQRKWNVRMMANGSLCIALSFVLSYVRLYKLPQGGSITLASMLPLFMFSYAYGVGPGMLTGMAYGILQFIQDAYFVHPIELILDYPLAFAMLGLCGLAPRFSERYGMIPGITLGVLGRFLCAFISGIVFFGMYAPEGQHVMVYSAVYNGLYLIPEAAICIILAMIPQIRRLARTLSLS